MNREDRSWHWSMVLFVLALFLAGRLYAAYEATGADFRGCGVSRDVHYLGLVCAWSLP